MTWRVTVEEGMGISVTFQTFEVEVRGYMNNADDCESRLTVRRTTDF